MEQCTVTVVLANNKRAIDGLNAIEDQLLAEHVYDIIPWTIRSDAIQATIEEVDFGRYDSEGYSYLFELLNIVPSDLLEAYLED